MIDAQATRHGRYVAQIRGRFTVRAAGGQDLTPSNRKERAVLAMLAISPERRLSRRWIEAMLWSESTPARASASLRRAVANLRAAFGEHAPLLETNRQEIWLADALQIERRPDLIGRADLLEMVEAPDPAFDEWLREVRANDAAQTERRTASTPFRDTAVTEGRGTVIVIRATADHSTDQGRFVEAIMIDILSARFEAEGADEIYAGTEPDPERLERAATVLHLELVSMVDDAWWIVHLRALADRDRRFLWSGRLRVPFTPGHLADGIDAQAFASRAITQIMLRYHAFRNAAQSPLMVMQRAATRLYDPSPDRVRLAEADLAGLASGEGAGVALAWRSFAGLARSLEFGETTARDGAEEMATEALARRPGNALVGAIAARVAMDLTGDLDHAEHLAAAATTSDEGNPYALQAAGRIALLNGRLDEARDKALLARSAADGLAHVFAWDFELCLTALAQGDLTAAHQAIRAAHRRNGAHRATLRYLIAISLLVGEAAEARAGAAKLAQIEPGFRIADLRRPDYPVLTLRRLGLTGDLPT